MARKNQKNLKLVSPTFRVVINGYELREEQIIDIKLKYSIHSLIPTGSISFRDPSGLFMANFKVAIGSSVLIYLVNTLKDGKQSDVFEFHTWVVTGITDDSSIKQDYFAGNITLDIAHPWAIYKDYDTHAYGGMVLSKLLKKVLEESNRGLQIEVGNIVDTQDLGNRPRYKFQISDDRFIEEMILPYCSSEGQSCYAYLTEMGQFSLDNFKSMFEREDKVCFISSPTEQEVDSVNIIKEFDDIKVWKSPSLIIGGSKQTIENIGPEFIFDDESSNSVMAVKGKYSYFTSDEKLLPFDKTFFGDAKASGTAKRLFLNRFPDDMIALSRSLFNDPTFLFKISFASDFTNKTGIGDTLYLNILYKDVGKKIEKDHWINGRWVVEGIVYYSEGAQCFCKQAFSVGRPDFTVEQSGDIKPNGKSSLAEISASTLATGKKGK